MTKVLVVEDNAASRRLVQVVLRTAGHDVVAVEDAKEALAQERMPELALLDIQLPDMDGIELCGHLRGRWRDQVRFVAMTAYATVGDQQQFLDAGFDACLPKPLDLEELTRVAAAADSQEEPWESGPA